MREIPTNRLNKKVVKAWRIGGLIGAFFIAVLIIIAVTILSVFTEWMILGLIIGIVILALFIGIYIIIVPIVRYNIWRFNVTEEEIDIYCGVIVRKRIIIPLVRVQMTDTSQGPIMKSFGLAEVTINTAGGDMTIPGLLDEDADALRDKVAKLAFLAREEV